MIPHGQRLYRFRQVGGNVTTWDRFKNVWRLPDKNPNQENWDQNK
jgi:hypothetical protein